MEAQNQTQADAPDDQGAGDELFDPPEPQDGKNLTDDSHDRNAIDEEKPRIVRQHTKNLRRTEQHRHHKPDQPDRHQGDQQMLRACFRHLLLAQQILHGNIIQVGDLGQNINVRRSLRALPLGNGLVRVVQFFRQPCLRVAVELAIISNILRDPLTQDLFAFQHLLSSISFFNRPQCLAALRLYSQ